MPYYIGKHPDCEGEWSVVKDDGTLLACHTNKENAIAQMVAVSLSEDLEPAGEYDGEYRAPAPKKDQITGSDKNPKGSAKDSGGGIELDEKTQTALRNKVTEHNNDMAANDKPDWTRTSYGQLSAVYRRGAGAYSTSHRPGVSRGQWAMARVNAYLYLLRNGNPQNSNYITDNDLLPTGHPKSTRAARDLPDAYRPALADDVPEGRACGNCYFFNEERVNTQGDKAWCEKWDEFVDGGYYCDAWEPDIEQREVNLTPPAYMRAAARQGLRYYEDGKAGDGVTPKTIAEARAMANGSVTADKWVRLRAWIARHLVDLDAPDANPSSDNYPSAGVVAHLLWGSGPTKRGAQRAMDYADSVVTRLEEENAGRARGQALSKIETRIWANDFEVREEADGMRLTGYAARFGEWSEPMPFREIIKRGAFRRSLDSRNDIKLLWNHDSSKVLGSTRAKTLFLEEREEGLYVDALLPDTSYGRDAKVSIQRGDVTGFSFGFSVPAGGDTWNNEGTERTLKSVRLIEVSTGVAFPAYPSTNGTAQVRGLEMVAERAYVDVDDLADAIVLMEAGGTLPTEAANILRKVIDALAEEEEMEEQEPSLEEVVMDATETNAAPEADLGDVSVLELIKKKLYLLERN